MIRKAREMSEDVWISLEEAAAIAELHPNTIRNNKDKIGWRRRKGKGGCKAPLEISRQGLKAWIDAYQFVNG